MKHGQQHRVTRISFERKILGNIYGPMLNPNTVLYEWIKNVDLKLTVLIHPIYKIFWGRKSHSEPITYGVQSVDCLDRYSLTSQIKTTCGRPWQRWIVGVKDDLKRLRNGAIIED